MDMMVTRFKNQLWKKFSLDMEVIGEEQYIDDADIRELYQFIGVLAPGHTDIVSLDDIRHTSNPVGREPLRCATSVSHLFFEQSMISTSSSLTAVSSDDSPFRYGYH